MISELRFGDSLWQGNDFYFFRAALRFTIVNRSADLYYAVIPTKVGIPRHEDKSSFNEFTDLANISVILLPFMH